MNAEDLSNLICRFRIRHNIPPLENLVLKMSQETFDLLRSSNPPFVRTGSDDKKFDGEDILVDNDMEYGKVGILREGSP